MATTDTRRPGLEHPPADDAASQAQAHRDMTRLRIKIARRIASLRLLQSEPKVASPSPAEAEDSTGRLPGNERLIGGIGLEDHRRHRRREDDEDEDDDDDADSQGGVHKLELHLRSWWRDLVKLARAFPEQACSSQRDAVSVLYLAQMAAVDKVRAAETYTRRARAERDEIRARRRPGAGATPPEGGERSLELFKTPDWKKAETSSSSSSSSSSSGEDEDDFTRDDFTRDDDHRLPGRLLWRVPPHDHLRRPSPTEPDRVADGIVKAAVVALDQATSDLTEATARLRCIVEAVNNEAAAEIQLSAEAKAKAVEAKRRATARARVTRTEKKRRRAREQFESLKRLGGVQALRERHAAKVERERAEQERLEEASRSNEGPEDAEEATGDSTLNTAPAPAPSPVPSPPTILASLSAEQPVAERKRKRAGSRKKPLGSLESPELQTPVDAPGLRLAPDNQLDKDLSEWWRENPGVDVKVAMTVDEEGELCVAICSPH